MFITEHLSPTWSRVQIDTLLNKNLFGQLISHPDTTVIQIDNAMDAAQAHINMHYRPVTLLPVLPASRLKTVHILLYIIIWCSCASRDIKSASGNIISMLKNAF